MLYLQLDYNQIKIYVTLKDLFPSFVCNLINFISKYL
jgi:hypothetical protein